MNNDLQDASGGRYAFWFIGLYEVEPTFLAYVGSEVIKLLIIGKHFSFAFLLKLPDC